MNRRNRELLASPYFIWSVGFTVIPLIVILRYAFTNAGGAFTVENILAIGDSINRKAFLFSLEIALICTLLCILLAYPLVMVVRRLHISRRAFMLFLDTTAPRLPVLTVWRRSFSLVRIILK